MARLKRILALAGLLLVVLLIVWFLKERSREATPAISWQTANPVLSPFSHPLAQGGAVTAEVEHVPLPTDQLVHADWLLPITSKSSLGYVLHDGQARWVVQDRIWHVPSAPIDPADNVSYAPNGLALGWATPDGVEVATARPFHVTRIPRTTAIAFTTQNIPVTLKTAGHKTQVLDDGHPAFMVQGQVAERHPFLAHGTQLAVDQGGRLDLYRVPSGHKIPVARVRPARWPDLVSARAFGLDQAFLLKRPEPLPAYLLIVKTPQRLYWYRWTSGLTPELGVSEKHLVLGEVLANTSIAILRGGKLTPLGGVSAGTFSSSPRGVIWSTASGFLRLRGWHS